MQFYTFIPANLSSFGEIRYSDVEIGYSRDLCKSEEFLFGNVYLKGTVSVAFSFHFAFV